MPKLRELSQKDALSFFAGQGFSIIGQNGSHIKIRRIISGTKQILIIPNHRSIRRGTAREIFNQSVRYIREDILRDFFYTK